MDHDSPPSPSGPVRTTGAGPSGAAPGPRAPETATARQAFLYLQASIIGTLANFVSRFAWSELVGFEAGVLLATYTGMVIVFLLSYRRAFGVRRPDAAMGLRFVLVAHAGMAVVWVVSVAALRVAESLVPLLPGWPMAADGAGVPLHDPAAWRAVLPQGGAAALAPVMGRALEGGCHAAGIVAGFVVNFAGHKLYSFRRQGGDAAPVRWICIVAVAVPVAYVAGYAPYGMDTTDFGFFYGHAWRILQGEVPYRDFFYVKPPLSLYWHAFWLWLTPERFSVLAGKAGFYAEMLAASWLGALYLARAVDLRRLGVPLPLLATLGFVWSVHSFPPMPWHTVEGVLFGAGALYAVAAGHPLLAGMLAAASALTKQSYALMPLGVAMAALVAGRAGMCSRGGGVAGGIIATLPEAAAASPCRARLHGLHWRDGALAVLGAAASFAVFAGLLRAAGAWNAFRAMTVGQTGLGEALQAGVVLYLTQDLPLPALALLLWGAWAVLDGRPRGGVQPLVLYVLLLAGDYLYTVATTRSWNGYGADWPLLLVTVGAACVLLSGDLVGAFAVGCGSEASEGDGKGTGMESGGKPVEGAAPAVPPVDRAAVLLGAGLLLAWSTGISWGYKTPAFFAAPLWLAAMLVHAHLGGRGATLAWVALVCGLVMFRVGYQYPYVFPQRPLSRAELVHDAGAVFPRLSGVKVDGVLLGTLRDLRDLRARYGANYKTLPGFPLAYLLTGDRPALPAEWLQDGEINGRVDEVYGLLAARDVVVFMERDQMDTVAPDGYARTRYSVPERVRREWRAVDETEHFVVFRRP
ncbi:putative membrane protein [Desulfovibrio sp. A2]|nr:putative membrane protein [Desulfovibrio sp. A2]